ncbi:MAG: hypothetical protein WDN69_08535 [Aliidongia sp.]
MLSALAGTDVPVPKTRLLCTDDSVIGQMFYVMDHVPAGSSPTACCPAAAPKSAPRSMIR